MFGVLWQQKIMAIRWWVALLFGCSNDSLSRGGKEIRSPFRLSSAKSMKDPLSLGTLSRGETISHYLLSL